VADITDGCPCDWCRIIRNIEQHLATLEQAVNNLTTPRHYTGDTPDHSTPPA